MKRKFWISAIALLLVLALLAPSALAAGSQPDISGGETPEGTDPIVPGGEETPEETDPIVPGGEETPEGTDPIIPGGGEGGEELQPEESVPFSVSSLDGEGRPIKGYWSAKDETWYLFLTSTQNITEAEVYFTGAVTATSAGTLDAENSVIKGAFAASGESIELTTADETVHRVAAYQSALPSVYIDLEGTNLADIHADKDKKHKGNNIYISDPNGVFDLSVEGSLEIKGRGNSTWREYEKKAYQIKFDDKTSLMGMGKAKKWILLANASDDSMMRSQLVYEMAENMDMPFVTSFEYVDLWIEGEYRGTFLLGEKVELGSSRLDLENNSGALFEHDEDFYMDEDYWFLNATLNRHFTMKEIVEEEEQFIDAAVADFDSALSEFVLYLYSTPSAEITLADLSEMIDVDSFIKYYLVNEFTLNRESFSTSFYWYKDGAEDTVHMGPIWDFDTCMGNDGEPNTGSHGDQHVLFHYLLAVPEFRARALELLELYRPVLESMVSNIDNLKAEIAGSAVMNYLRWDVLGKPNPKGGADFYPTFDEAVEALRSWLSGRASAFFIPEPGVVTSVVSEDCRKITMNFKGGQEYDKVVFALWSQEGGTDDITWHTASRDGQGGWSYAADLGVHNSKGIYYIYAYTNDQSLLLGSGRNYVEIAQTPLYPFSAEVDAEGVLSLKMGDETGEIENARFAIWLMSDHLNTLKWINAEKDEDGIWKASYPLCRYEMSAEDILISHAYSGTAVIAETALEPVYPATHIAGPGTLVCKNCGAEIYSAEIAKTPMFRLYNPNSGEHFYTGSEEERDFLAGLGWHYEGIAWHAPISVGEPVYRVYNPNSGDHHYTMSNEEVRMLVGYGWLYEGVAWNSAPEGSAQYRLYNPNADLGSHHYTGSTEERDFLVGLGWIWEGIGWYGIIEE